MPRIRQDAAVIRISSKIGDDDHHEFAYHPKCSHALTEIPKGHIYCLGLDALAKSDDTFVCDSCKKLIKA